MTTFYADPALKSAAEFAKEMAAEPRRDLQVMIDLETLGVGGNACVMQLGIVVFEMENPKPVYQSEWNVTAQSCLFLGGEIEPGTLDWWRKRPVANRAAVEQSGYSMRHVMDNVFGVYKEFRPTRTWCHGATFDVPIMAGYYDRAGLKTPWDFWTVRDTRTLFDLARELVGWERVERDTAHTGLADALAQTADVQEAWAALKHATDIAHTASQMAPFVRK